MNGTVFYDANNKRWIARYPAGRFNTGKVIAGYGQTAEKAMARRDAALKRALNGTMRGGTITVRHVLMKYMAWIEQGNDRRNSIARKRDRLERYLKPYMGKPMKSFDSDDVGAIITAARAASTDSANSKIAKTMWGEIHQMCDFAIQRGMIEKNPTDYVIRPKYTSAARRTNELHIDERIEQGRWMLEHAARDGGTAYGMLLLACMGLRAGEIRGMEYKCFTHLLDGAWDSTTMTVQQIYDRDVETGEWRLMKHTKSNAMTHRTLAVPKPWAYNIFCFYEQIQDKYKLPYDYDGFMCLNKDGKPLTKNQQSTIWNDLRRAYINEHPDRKPIASTMRIHDMRHVIASVLVMNGATLERVRPILGHMNAEMTAYYTALSTGFNRATMNELPELMNHGNNLLNFININNENKISQKNANANTSNAREQSEPH